MAGTGDAPTLHAAMDSAKVGDTVLAEAGEYLLESGLLVPQGVVLIGESGPAHTLLYRDDYLASTTLGLVGGAVGIHVRANTLPVVNLGVLGGAAENCIFESTGQNILIWGGAGEFRNCLFVGDGEIAVVAEFLACIIMSDLGSGAIGSTVLVCDVLGSVHPAIDVSSANFNFSLDPQFCGIPGSGNYFLQSSSPCLPENNPYGFPGLVGPLPVGCGTVPVQEQTWGSIKAMYR